MKTKIIYIAKTIAPFVFFICMWLVAISFSKINRALLPAPQDVFFALKEFVASRTLIPDISSSLFRAIAGFAIGGSLGLACGSLTARIPFLNWLISPIFNGLRALPPVSIVPLVIVWAGMGESGKIFITSWAAFFPVWLNTHDGITSVDKNIIWAARSLGAKNMHLLFDVILPSAIPRIVIGFRLAVSTTLVCVIVAEMTGATVGLGYRLELAYLVFRVDRMIACLLVLAIIGISADRLFARFSSIIFPWIALRHELK